MPLQSGSSDEIISKNISEMEKAGHPHDQAVAAALHNADEEKKKKRATLFTLLAMCLGQKSV